MALPLWAVIKAFRAETGMTPDSDEMLVRRGMQEPREVASRLPSLVKGGHLVRSHQDDCSAQRKQVRNEARAGDGKVPQGAHWGFLRDV
jgi:hypothetical protein